MRYDWLNMSWPTLQNCVDSKDCTENRCCEQIFNRECCGDGKGWEELEQPCRMTRRGYVLKLSSSFHLDHRSRHSSWSQSFASCQIELDFCEHHASFICYWYVVDPCIACRRHCSTSGLPRHRLLFFAFVAESTFGVRKSSNQYLTL
jgi:hypothetical protein